MYNNNENIYICNTQYTQQYKTKHTQQQTQHKHIHNTTKTHPYNHKQYKINEHKIKQSDTNQQRETNKAINTKQTHTTHKT